MILIDHETHSEIDATLMSAPEWRCVYFDPVAAVYLHREAKTQPAPSPVNFPSALFQTNGDQQGDVRMPSHDKTVMAVQLDPRFREATALHRIAGNLLLREQRGQSFDLQLARSMLLLARSRTDAVNASHHSYELDRLRGQISFALHPLTGRQLRTNEFESFIWDSAAMLDLGRARYFLERARQQRPDDFSTLAYLYELSSVQLDRDAQRRFGNELIQTGARNAAQRGVLQSVIADHRLARDPDAAQPPVDLNTVTDIDTARRLVSQYLATQQPQLAQRALLACRQRLGRLPWDLAERLADLSLFLGSPGTGLEPRSIEGHFDESKLLARRGTAQLVMASLRTSVETYEAALELDSGNLEACFGLARAYLELGDAARSMAYCQRALALTSNDDETRHNLDWMTDLVGRSVPP
jgi:tetratricopeptide (TPR) repeat protein